MSIGKPHNSQSANRALSVLAFIFLAGAAAAQNLLGIGMLKNPVTVTVKNASKSSIAVGFSRFVGLDGEKDCVEEVFYLEPGQSKSYAGISYGPCFYYAQAKDAPLIWGGKVIWEYQGFPEEENVFAKPFYLDQDDSGSLQRTISLSEGTAWISDAFSAYTYLQFMRYKADWFKWKFMVEFVPCAPNEERRLEAVNLTSSPLRLFVESKVYETKTYSNITDVPSYRVIPRGAKAAISPRSGLPAGYAEEIRVSACQETGPLYWHGMDSLSGKSADFGGVAAPKTAMMPLLKGYKTVMTFTDDRAMGSGRYRFLVLNRGSHTVDLEVWRTPYPGDDSYVRESLAPGDSATIVTPNASVSWQAKATEGRHTYTWEKKTVILKDESAYGSCDSVYIGN